MTSRAQRYLVLPAVGALVVLVDQVTKHLVRIRLAPGQSTTLAPWLTPVLQITHVTNTGAAFGLFRGFSQVFIGVAVIVIVALIWYYLQLPRGQWLLHHGKLAR